jgi:hypothetical protein
MKVFDAIRRITTFLLGVAIIVNALIHPDERLGQLAIGMVMVGVLPVESLTFWQNRSK